MSCPYLCILTEKSIKGRILITPAGRDGAVEPERILSVLRPVGLGEFRDVIHRQTVVNVAFHVHLSIWLVRVHVDQSGDHVWGEGHDEGLENGKWGFIKAGRIWVHHRCYHAPTLVTTERMAIPLRISCQAPMLWAFAATGRLNWVVSFQASTRTSIMLLNSANRGANGKEATNRVMKPNWITGTAIREKGQLYVASITAPCTSSARERLHSQYLPISRYS